MNSQSHAFQEDIKAWVRLDTALREINTQCKTLREDRAEIEKKITGFVAENNMEDTSIRINDSGKSGLIGFHTHKSLQPLSMKLVRGCLEDLISDPDCVEAIMEHIRESRDQRSSLNIKRTFE